VGSLTREVALEKELTDATEKLSKMKVEKEQLEASVQVCPWCFNVPCAGAEWGVPCAGAEWSMYFATFMLALSSCLYTLRLFVSLCTLPCSLIPANTQELHKRLTDMEAASSSVRRQSVLSMMDLGGGGMLMHSSEASSNMDAALKRGEREKQMELLVSFTLFHILQTCYHLIWL
jgi:hypothetical protein